MSRFVQLALVPLFICVGLAQARKCEAQFRVIDSTDGHELRYRIELLAADLDPRGGVEFTGLRSTPISCGWYHYKLVPLSTQAYARPVDGRILLSQARQIVIVPYWATAVDFGPSLIEGHVTGARLSHGMARLAGVYDSAFDVVVPVDDHGRFTFESPPRGQFIVLVFDDRGFRGSQPITQLTAKTLVDIPVR